MFTVLSGNENRENISIVQAPDYTNTYQNRHRIAETVLKCSFAGCYITGQQKNIFLSRYQSLQLFTPVLRHLVNKLAETTMSRKELCDIFLPSLGSRQGWLSFTWCLITYNNSKYDCNLQYSALPDLFGSILTETWVERTILCHFQGMAGHCLCGSLCPTHWDRKNWLWPASLEYLLRSYPEVRYWHNLCIE